MLDARHPDLPKAQMDANAYILGSIGCHNVVITCLPMNCYGTNQTARAAAQMLNTFSAVKITLMVGIGAGIPTKVGLGDVVISTGWTRWEFGKTKNGVFEHVGKRYFPPKELSSAMPKLQAEHNLDETRIQQQLDKFRSENQKLSLKYTSIENFWNSEGHPCQTSENGALQISKGSNSARVHYGLITSGNQVVKDASLRDEIDSRLQSKVLCIETEAAVLMEFPAVIVRGICDYADETKNDDWQENDLTAFLEVLFTLRQDQYINILATSRYIPEIEDRFSGISIQLEIRAIEGDVRNYLESQILQRGTRVLKNNKAIVQDEIWRASQGMFPLAHLYFESIKSKLTMTKINMALKSLTSGDGAYDRIYQDIMDRITEQDLESRNLAYKIISWITYATRPLKKEELQRAVAVELDETEIEEINGGASQYEFSLILGMYRKSRI
ncbi:hypothetical protein TWF706_009220 [Orbilia oligospora]|nr:hypothetical protein TWF706_009220 [Orbilia oligospora]